MSSSTSWIVLAAIFAPIITALVNNAHQTNLRKTEIQQENVKNFTIHKRDIFENYIKHTSYYLCYPGSIEAKDKYKESFFIAMTYSDSSIQEQMQNIDQFISNKNYPYAIAGLANLTPDIADLIQTELQQPPQLLHKSGILCLLEKWLS